MVADAISGASCPLYFLRDRCLKLMGARHFCWCCFLRTFHAYGMDHRHLILDALSCGMNQTCAFCTCRTASVIGAVPIKRTYFFTFHSQSGDMNQMHAVPATIFIRRSPLARCIFHNWRSCGMALRHGSLNHFPHPHFVRQKF